MGRVSTNNISMSYTIESALGVAGTTWKQLEPNSIGNFGANITTVARSPISKNRQRRKGVITDLDSGADFAADLTLEHFIDFMEGFAFASFNGPLSIHTSAAVAGGSGGYTVASGGALAANTLVYASGFVTDANNGLKVVQSGSGSTNIRVNGLTAETAPANAMVEVAGVRGAAGDLEIDSNGDLISTTLDFTTLGLTAGQVIWVGGADAANQFFTDADTGFARIVTVAVNKLTLDKKATTFTVDDGTDTGSGGTAIQIDILFGRFLRNVTVDDADYLERSFQFEVAYENLQNPSGDEYEYCKGNYCNQVTFNLPLTDKATLNFGFIGTDTDVPTTSRKTGASSATAPLRTESFNTTADVARLRITEVDETGLTTDFKNLTLTINNNVSPEKVIGTLGARYMNTGNFEVGLEAQLLFTEGDVVDAIRNNTTLTMDFALKNGDGGLFFDIPSMTLSGGGKDFPVNESVLINTTAQAFADTTLNTSIGVSLFPYLP